MRQHWLVTVIEHDYLITGVATAAIALTCWRLTR